MKLRNLLIGAAIMLVLAVSVSVFVSGCSSAVVEKTPVLPVLDNTDKDINAWIMSVEDGLVTVQVVGVKTFITFRPPDGELNRFSSHVNYLVPVRFECTKVSKNNVCDLSAPYKLYISRMLIELVRIEGSVFVNK